MRILLAIVLMASLLCSLPACRSGSTIPDVSHLQAPVAVQRFDLEFFSLDTLLLETALRKLEASYPHFFPQYMSMVLGIQAPNTEGLEAVKAFLRSYAQVQQQAAEVWAKHAAQWQQQTSQVLKYWKYYFPNRRVDSPFVLIPFIGPMDALEPFSIGDYGDVRTPNGAGIAMQFHLGSQAQVYETGMQSGLLYDYQVRRFTPQTVVVNLAKNLIDDAFAYQPASLNLIEQMVEKGRRLVVLDLLLPQTPDSLKLGYTGGQVLGCQQNEALIWNYFVKNDLLYSKDPSLLQLYLRDGPKTQELGEGAPGYIGLFLGRQIVRAFMDKYPQTTPEQLMQMPPRQVFEQAGYKPK